MLLIIIFCFVLIAFLIYSIFFKNKSRSFTLQNSNHINSLENQKNDIILSYGEAIQNKLQTEILNDIRTEQADLNKDLNNINIDLQKDIKEDNVEIITTKTNPNNRIPNKLNSKIKDFLNKCSKYIVGKYALIEKTDVSFVNKTVYELYSKYYKNKNINYKEEWNVIISETTKQLFYNIKDPSKKLILGQSIIKNSNSNEEIIFIYSKIVEIASDQRIPTVIRMNAVDILNMSNNNKYTSIAKKLIRELGVDTQERKTNFQKRLENVYNRASKIPSNSSNQSINNFPVIPVTNRNNNIINNDNMTDYLEQAIIDQIPFAPIAKKPERTIYQDGQNVHVTKINETALDTSKEIVDKFKPINTINFEYKRIADFPDEKKQKIEGAIHRLTTDPSEFRNNSLYTIYQSLLNMINSHPQKDDLYNRLIEEMLDMYKMCATGHLTRLVNVIQGFDTKINNKIQVNISDELYGKIKFLIEKDLQEAPNSDELLDDILTPDKKLYIQFINDKVKTYTPKIYEEYKSVSSQEEIKKVLKSSLDKYTQTKEKIIID